MTENSSALVFWFVIVALGLLFLWYLLVTSRRKPNRVDTHYMDFWGRRRRRIKYNDTGKVVNQVRTKNWRGQTVKSTYVDKRCFRCGAKVTAVKNGVYRCKCGNQFR